MLGGRAERRGPNFILSVQQRGVGTWARAEQVASCLDRDDRGGDDELGRNHGRDAQYREQQQEDGGFRLDSDSSASTSKRESGLKWKGVCACSRSLYLVLSHVASYTSVLTPFLARPISTISPLLRMPQRPITQSPAYGCMIASRHLSGIHPRPSYTSRRVSLACWAH